ncbi:unnamed protein product [Cladocopium goreaui]|uniref:Histone-lysine N-methyltransferase SMYD3 n=1 Tax=Cladocopium goreaui TaxID=2562237 RepID=A0A9P1FEL6_9DINO|nr:unnamed protein product [Cladocopium goreaui]
MARRICILWIMLFSHVYGEAEHQKRLNKLAELLEDEGDNLKAMAAALHKESGTVEDAISRQEDYDLLRPEAAAIKAVASGTNMLNLGGEALSSSVKGLRGSELQTAQTMGSAVSLEAVDGESSELDSNLEQSRGSRTVGRPSSQVGTLSREEKRLQDLLGLR